MPYTGTRDASLPSYVKKLSDESRNKWVSVFNHFYKTKGEERAFIAANTWLKKHMQKQLIARNTKVRSVIRFNVDTSKEFIKRTDSGEEYITAMLQDVYGDTDGIRWSADVLRRFAEQINSGANLVGDIDHEEYDRIMSAAMTDDEVMSMFKKKQGIAKSVEAIFQDGRLWIKALIDKRYKKLLMEKAKGLSLEAVVTKDDYGNVVEGDILGWSFMIDDKDSVANPRTAGTISG